MTLIIGQCSTISLYYDLYTAFIPMNKPELRRIFYRKYLRVDCGQWWPICADLH